jgi:hypothetical protein
MLQIQPSFNDYKSLLTPRQFELFMKPELQEFINHFSLIPVKQKEVAFNEKIPLKVESWLAEFADPNRVVLPPPAVTIDATIPAQVKPTETKRTFRGWKSLIGVTIECQF